MATQVNSTSKKVCSKCEKSKGAFSCDGCQQSFCLKHVAEHRQELISQMDIIEQEHDIFHEDLLNRTQKQHEHTLFNRIDQWEKESIKKIEQIANESRITLKQILDTINNYGEKSLNKIFVKLRRARESDDFFENDLTRWTQQLNHLRAEIECMSNSINIIDEKSTSVIKFIKIVHDQNAENPDINWISPFSWLSDVRALFYDRSKKSLSTLDNEMKHCSIIIVKVNNIDHYIDIENDSSIENDQNMKGWTLRRDVNKKSKIIYKFPDDFILKCLSKVRIIFGKKSDIQEKDKDILILINENIEESWDTGSYIVTYLIDADGEEKASMIQIIPSS